MTSEKKPNRFMTWRDMIITPLAELIICSAAFYCTLWTKRTVGLDITASIFLFFVFEVAVSLVFLKIVRTFFPLKPGIFSYSADPLTTYIWNLQGFLCEVNINLELLTTVLPFPLRKVLYSLTGANIGKGIVVIGGRISDPSMVTIEEGATLGFGSFVCGHVIVGAPDDHLMLGRVHIGKGALIGIRAIIMPGVRIGANSMVNAMSVVSPNTVIPPNEIWGGAPAKKIGDMAPITVEPNPELQSIN